MDRQRAIKRPRNNSMNNTDPASSTTTTTTTTTEPHPSNPSSSSAINTNKPKQKKHKKDHHHKHDKSKSKSKHKNKHDGGGASGAAAGSVGGVDGSLESTATKEGRTISQALSTFNSIEQNRFEAFRRCALNASSISNFVAHCLAMEAERRFCMRNGARELLGVDGRNGEFGVGHPSLHGSSSGSSSSGGGEGEKKKKKRKSKVDLKEEEWLNAALKKRPQFHTTATSSSSSEDTETPSPPPPNMIHLQDLVAPNNAQEITAVVSTLAKCYAQRLISAARRVASSEQIPKKTPTTRQNPNNEEKKDHEEEEEYQNYPDDAPILPHHLLTAYKYRTNNGLDPGFFLRPCNEFLHGSKRGLDSSPITGFGGGGKSSVESAACGMEDKYKLRLNACLEAQDVYDEFMKKKKKKEEERDDDDEDDDKMKE